MHTRMHTKERAQTWRYAYCVPMDELRDSMWHNCGLDFGKYRLRQAGRHARRNGRHAGGKAGSKQQAGRCGCGAAAKADAIDAELMRRGARILICC